MEINAQFYAVMQAVANQVEKSKQRFVLSFPSTPFDFFFIIFFLLSLVSLFFWCCSAELRSFHDALHLPPPASCRAFLALGVSSTSAAGDLKISNQCHTHSGPIIPARDGPHLPFPSTPKLTALQLDATASEAQLDATASEALLPASSGRRRLTATDPAESVEAADATLLACDWEWRGHSKGCTWYRVSWGRTESEKKWAKAAEREKGQGKKQKVENALENISERNATAIAKTGCSPGRMQAGRSLLALTTTL
jgi:hypothetical protein